MAQRRRRVLFLNVIDYYNRATHRGVVAYAVEQGWSLNYLQHQVTDQLLKDLQAIDGLIIQGVRADGLARIRSSLAIPIVAISAWTLGEPIKHVLFNEQSVGRLAAEHLIEKGFRRLIMASWKGDVNDPRYRGLASTAAEHPGVSVAIIRMQELTGDYLAALQRPFAIIAQNDRLAPEIMYRLEDNQVSIPLDAAVIGFDNDPLYAETTTVPLSSVVLNASSRGREAARYLQELMDGNEIDLAPHYIEPARVVSRASTDIYAVEHTATARALQYIRDHIRDGDVAIKDVVQHAGISRRALESEFKKRLHQSIAYVILKHRIDWAIELIRSGDRTMANVAETCGFSSSQAMSRSFTRVLDCSPSSFRSEAVDAPSSRGHRDHSARIPTAASQRGSTTDPAKRRRVLYLNLTNFYNRATHKGIVEYARQQGWSLSHATMSMSDRLFERIALEDGIIVHGASEAFLTTLAARHNIPVVITTPWTLNTHHKHVLFDPDASVRMAFEHLYSRGFRRMFFVESTPGTINIGHRCQAFMRVAHAYPNAVATPIAASHLDHAFLQSLPRPFALVSVNDRLAPELIYRLEDAGLSVPEDAAVLGFDNDLLYCVTTSVPLSSVRLNATRRGYVAARTLHQLMEGDTSSPQVQYIEPDGVVVRASTDVYAVTHEPTARALRYIRANLEQADIAVDDVVAYAGIHRRALEQAFSDHLNSSIANVIAQMRVDWAIELIRKNQQNMAEIARTCRFSSPQAMSRSFNRVVGRQPSSYRPESAASED